MFKGRVRIDLHDHRTGLREMIEGENEITSALQDMINTQFASFNFNRGTNLGLISETMLGGIWLMDKVLSSDTVIPNTATLTGSGYFQGSNTDSNIIGTYNSLESGYDEATLTHTHVYDFATSQSNGTIRSLALVKKSAGQYPFLTVPDGVITISDIKRPFYIDENDLYYVNYTTGEIFKIAKFAFNKMRIHDQFSNTIPVGVSTGKTVTFPAEGFYHDGYDGYVYTFSFSGATVSVTKIKVDDYSFTQSANYVTYTLPNNPSGTRETTAVTEDYFYFFSNNAKSIYRVDKSNGTISTIDLTDKSIADSFNFIVYENGNVLVTFRKLVNASYKGCGIFINNNGDLKYDVDSGLTYANASPSGYQKKSVYISGQYVYLFNHVLMSNYNLPEAITKTNNQSMKVTYSITMV